MTQLYLSMPQPGETITEGTIVKWLIKPGDSIKETDPIAELETEKAVFDYESPFEGKIVKLLHNEGTRVKVATSIAIVDVAEEKAEYYLSMGIAKAVNEDAKQQEVVAKSKVQVQQKIAVNQSPAVEIETQSDVDIDSLKLSPYVRRLAFEHHIANSTLAKLAAQNSNSRVTKEEIENYLSKGHLEIPSTKPSPKVGDFSLEPCSAIRMRIADNMVLSKSKIPHAHTGIAVDLTEVVKFRDKHKENFKNENGAQLNLLSLIYPALVKAIEAYPMINASYDDSTNPHQIKTFHKINLGVAVGSKHGLVIPVVSDIGSLNFKEFNSKLNSKVELAQNKKLKPNDLMGATLIFNNFGFFGMNTGVQVIQYPLAATLGMSVIEKRVVPVGDAIGVRTMSDFILSFDHRVMDGRETGLFLSTLKKEIEGLTEFKLS